MPRGDGRGPMGIGPMTGRGAGYCAGFGMPGASNDYVKRGFGMGFGRGAAFRGCGFGGGGRGLRNRYHATGLPGWIRSDQYGAQSMKTDPELEKQALKARGETLQAELDILKKRLEEIEHANADAV